LGKSKAQLKSKQPAAKPTVKLPRDFYDIFTGSPVQEREGDTERGDGWRDEAAATWQPSDRRVTT